MVKIDGNRLTNYRPIRQKMAVKGRWSQRAPVDKKHEKLARRRRARAKAKKNEKPAEDPAYDLERSTSFSAKEILFWDEERRLVYQGSRGRARAHAYQSSCPRTNRQQQEIKERARGRRIEKVARIFAARNLFDWAVWEVRSERNETEMSLKVSWLYTLDKYSFYVSVERVWNRVFNWIIDYLHCKLSKLYISIDRFWIVNRIMDYLTCLYRYIASFRILTFIIYSIQHV